MSILLLAVLAVAVFGGLFLVVVPSGTSQAKPMALPVEETQPEKAPDVLPAEGQPIDPAPPGTSDTPLPPGTTAAPLDQIEPPEDYLPEQVPGTDNK